MLTIMLTDEKDNWSVRWNNVLTNPSSGSNNCGSQVHNRAWDSRHALLEQKSKHFGPSFSTVFLFKAS